MIPYILHVALLISVCLIFYKVFLQGETFYRLNRWVLIFCLALSFALPLIHIPQQWTLRETSKLAETPAIGVTSYNTPVVASQNNEVETLPALKPAVQSAVKTTPVIAKQPTVAFTDKAAAFLPRAVKWLFYIYWIGVAAFGLNLLLQLVVLLYQTYTTEAIRDGKFRIIELKGDKAPCSFGNNIFINPEKYDWGTYSQILLHEKIHIQQGHSFDILMAELVLVLQWFNPFAWLYRTELENNLEFLTDDAVLEHKEIERTSYQMSLLKVSAPHLSLGITTNYNQSLLKRRIVMMNAKKSNLHTMWKYFFLVPLLGVLACALNDPAAYSHPLSTNLIRNAGNSPAAWEHNMRAEGSWFADIKGEKLRVEFRSDEDDHNWSSSTDFKLSDFPSLPKNTKGDFTLTRDAGTMLFNGKFDGDQGYGHYKFTPSAAFKNYLKEKGITETNEGDDFAFFIMNVDKAYIAMLERNGYKNLTKSNLISMAALKVDEPYVKFWKENGYADLTPQQLVSGKALGITPEYIAEIHKAGYAHVTFEQLTSFKATGVDSKFIASMHATAAKTKKADKDSNDDDTPAPASQVVSAKATGVQGAYVNGMQKAGYHNLSLNDLVRMKSVGVTPEYVENMKKAGYTNLSTSDLISMKSMGISPEYIASLKAAGYANLTSHDLVSMKSLAVTPEYARSFAVAGYTNIPAHDLVSMKSVGVTSEFAKSVSVDGYKDASVHDLISMKSVGATAEYAKSFATQGYSGIPLRELVSMKSVGVTPEYVESLKAAGYKNIPANELVSMKAQGITPEYAKSFEAAGIKNLPERQLVSFRALGVTPEFIKGFTDAGYKDVPPNMYNALKAQGITPEFIQQFKKLGFDDISLNQACALKGSGVTPDYVKEMRAKGFKSDDVHKYIQLKNAFEQ
jgi:hypothetical protein